MNNESQRLLSAKRITILETHREQMADELFSTLSLDKDSDLTKKHFELEQMFLDLIKAEAEYLASL